MLKFSLLSCFLDRLHRSLYPSVFVCFYSYSSLFFKIQYYYFLNGGAVCVCVCVCVCLCTPGASKYSGKICLLFIFQARTSELISPTELWKTWKAIQWFLSISENNWITLSWEGSIEITESDPFLLNRWDSRSSRIFVSLPRSQT